MKKFFVLLFNFTMFLTNVSICTNNENKPADKIYIVIKESDSIWNSGPIKFTRSLGALGFRIFGCICLANACYSPMENRNAVAPIFVSNVFGAIFWFGIAECIKVKNNHINVEEENNNFIIIK